MRASRSLRALMFCLSLAVSAPRMASALCGDTNGDDALDASDALRTLKKAVGQSVDLVCNSEPEPPDNALVVVNTMFCNNVSFSIRTLWSEHPDLEWNSVTDSQFPLEFSDSQPINDLEMGGYFAFDLGQCGGWTFLHLDTDHVKYILPNHAVTSLILFYQASNDTIYVLTTLVPVDVSPASAISPTDAAMALPGLGVVGTLRGSQGLSAQQ